MSWIEKSRRNLKKLRKLMDEPDKDRLEYVRVMRYAFGALGVSLRGWMQWVSSPEVMANFDEDELSEMMQTITGMVETFIEYDIKMTEEGVKKGLGKRKPEKQERKLVV